MAKNSKEFIEGLAQLADDLRRQIDANLDGWDVSAAAIAERRRKVCDPLRGFAFWDQHYFPHYGGAAPALCTNTCTSVCLSSSIRPQANATPLLLRAAKPSPQKSA